MKHNALASAVSTTLLLALAACGGGSGGSASNSTPPPAATSAPVTVLVSDASSEDWSTIGVKLLGITLTPQGGGTPVTVYTASGAPPVINLVQLDQLGEILGNTSIPVGTYTSATLTLSANPGDLLLTTSANPEAGFAAAPGTTIDPAQIQVQGTSGATGSLTVPLSVTLDEPLVVSSSGSNALDLEFDLGHPAFLIAHVPAATGTTLWAVNFKGPVHQRPMHDLAERILRHAYGTVTAVSTDNKTLTITKDLPTLPAVSPETAVSTAVSLPILADAQNGTIFYDVDAKTHAVLNDFSSVAGTISGKYVRVAARYQQDGTLVATRIWASTSFNSVWLSPEGHVLNVDTTADTMTVTTESGGSVVLGVDANTQFFKRGSGNAAADSMPIGTGTAFLGNLARGFKVHASVVDPLATTLVAQTVEIQTAAYGGLITAADSGGVTYMHGFHNSANDYTKTLPYIAAATANGTDSKGAAITGFKWWNFAYPTLVTSGANAISDFVALASGAVNFGGTLGPIKTYGTTYATWNDPSAPNAWAAPWVVVQPSPLPLATVTTGLDSSNAFTMTALRGTNAVKVDVGTAAGSATLAYQVDRTGSVISISPIDVTTAAGLTTLTTDLAQGAPVKVAGVPQPDGTIKAYAVTVFTGETIGQ